MGDFKRPEDNLLGDFLQAINGGKEAAEKDCEEVALAQKSKFAAGMEVKMTKECL